MQNVVYPNGIMNVLMLLCGSNLSARTLCLVDPLTFGMSPIPAMILLLGLKLCVQQGVGLQSQRKTMKFFVRYILSSFMKEFPSKLILRIIPKFDIIMRHAFSELRRPEIRLPSIKGETRMMKRSRSYRLNILPPLHLRNLGKNVINGMALVGALNPRTLLQFEPLALRMSPILAMMNFLGLKLFVQHACLGHYNQTNNVSLFMRYMLSKLMRNPGKMIQMMIPNYHMFMTHVFFETKRTNPFCKPGIPYPIVPFFFSAIEPRHLKNFREMIRSCVSQMSYLHLELFTLQHYRVSIELHCDDNSIQYFSITVRDKYGSLVGAGDITELKASQQTRDLFVPKLTPFSICLSSSELYNLRPLSKADLLYTSSLSFNIGGRKSYTDFNLKVLAVKVSTIKP